MSPVQLQHGESHIQLRDYFPAGEWPDAIGTSSTAFQVETDTNQHEIILKEVPGEQIPTLSSLMLYFGEHQYVLPLKRSRKVQHTFIYLPGESNPQAVQIAGDMTNWNPTEANMKLVGEQWELVMELDPGVYQYQIVVDGEWMLDPANNTTVANGIGGFNSQLSLIGSGKEAVWPEIDLFEDIVILRKGNPAFEYVALWENGPAMIEEKEASFAIRVPEKAKSMDRSHLRIYVDGQNGEVLDYYFPLEKGRVITDPSRLTSKDQHANILYFLLVDRFNNGSTENDAPVEDERVHPKANYHGGDLAGVQEKLEDGYFDELGINTLWISPLNQNPEGAFQEWPEPRRWFSGYHGYWPVSSSKVDHRFGSNSELKSLVQASHDKGKKLILDFVANHVHEDHPMIKAHPEWKTDLYLKDSALNVRNWDSQRLTTWFDTFLPSLDFSNPEVIEIQADSAIFWLKEFGLDGFRHDATKHIPEAFWRRLTQRLKLEMGETPFQIGETFGSRELIGSYVGSGMMDGQFDFNLYFDLRRVLTDPTADASQLLQSFNASLGFYGQHSLMGNISGNHDMPRFMAFAGGGLLPGDDPKEAGWERQVEVTDETGYRKLEQLHAFLMVAPGLPVIYYGDEIGMTGANDPDSRRDMRFSDWNENEARVNEVCKSLIRFRKEHMATLYGQTKAYAMDDQSFVLVRSYFGEQAVLVLNLAENARSIPLNPEIGALHHWEQGSGAVMEKGENGPSVEVEGHGFALLWGKESNQ
jgi:cyclomaltodextrinase